MGKVNRLEAWDEPHSLMKQSSPELSTLAARVLQDGIATADEVKSLAASVLSQDETPANQPEPGPNDIVTITVGGKDKHGKVERFIEYGAATEHPDSDAVLKADKAVQAAVELKSDGVA